jgi:hypothetical protein
MPTGDTRVGERGVRGGRASFLLILKLEAG